MFACCSTKFPWSLNCTKSTTCCMSHDMAQGFTTRTFSRKGVITQYSRTFLINCSSYSHLSTIHLFWNKINWNKARSCLELRLHQKQFMEMCRYAWSLWKATWSVICFKVPQRNFTTSQKNVFKLQGFTKDISNSKALPLLFWNAFILAGRNSPYRQTAITQTNTNILPLFSSIEYWNGPDVLSVHSNWPRHFILRNPTY